jgi:primosomal protein N' (replication factor Y)
MRCAGHNAMLVYGSATPSAELYHRAENGGCNMFTLSERTNRRPLPEVILTDMREELKNKNRGMFSRKLSKMLADTLGDGKQAILFLNKRGYSSFLLCRSCGYIVSCRNCSVSFTYHRDNDKLVCHYCGLTAPVPGACPACGGADINGFGAGTEKVEREVRQMHPAAKVLRMDRDTASGKDSYSRILDAFRDREADILIGTQMIAKGHDFPDVTLVGVLAADSILNFSDFRATERTFQLLTQVAGRSGRGDAAGKVVIQTYNPDHFSITSSKKHDYRGFYKQEMIARRALLYPPFMNIGVCVLSGRNDARSGESASRLFAALEDGAPRGMTMLAPTRPQVAKIKERYRWRFIVKHEDITALEEFARRATEVFYGQKYPYDVDMAFDINPFSLV